jgi:hypothetical protein
MWFGRPSASGQYFFREKLDQEFVAASLELFDGAARSLVLAAVGDLVDQLARELGRDELGPGQLQGRPELVQHVAHAALAACEVEGEEGSHQ